MLSKTRFTRVRIYEINREVSKKSEGLKLSVKATDEHINLEKNAQISIADHHNFICIAYHV